MLVIFDLDGTLINPASGIIKSVEYVIDVLGLPKIEQDVIKKFIGPPIYDSLKSTFDLNHDTALKATEIFRVVYKKYFLYDAYVYKEIPLLLYKLKKNKKKLAVATYKRQEHAELILEYFNIKTYFDFIQGSIDGKNYNKKDIIEFCLNFFNLSEAVMIGDTIYDKKGAEELNIKFIGVPWGYGFDNNNSDVSSVQEIISKLA
ncbi:HAD-IA family hydrolase [Campylobacter coli]|nr:HAD-IA family hydrolase [Campylobacter coli]EDN5833738.1 HAD-IA family hydrolase [Campylobacter coli]